MLLSEDSIFLFVGSEPVAANRQRNHTSLWVELIHSQTRPKKMTPLRGLRRPRTRRRYDASRVGFDRTA